MFCYRYLTLLLAAGLVACAGNGGYGDGGEAADTELSVGATEQFYCANRNRNEYIDSVELEFLVRCGVLEGQACGTIPAQMDPPASNEQFRQGRRLLEIMDLNKDSRISKLEFRAFCNQYRS